MQPKQKKGLTPLEKITFDFKQQILSFGDAAEVLKPLSLLMEMAQAFENALKRYRCKVETL